MINISDFETLSNVTESILAPPFAWQPVKNGSVTLEDASDYEGTAGGSYQVPDFAMAKYPITNAQYEKFLVDPKGYSHSLWWNFSPEASQWHQDHKRPKPTAFAGSDLPRTRISWFDSMAFCYWLSNKLKDSLSYETSAKIRNTFIRLPTEQEWLRAAIGDTGWYYPWGDILDKTYANYANNVGQVSRVKDYPDAQSIYGVMDMVGNVWEWCLTGWNQDNIDVHGYTYRIIKGGAWNVTNPDFLRVTDRGGCHPPRGRLNDCGFRILCTGFQ